MTARQPAEIFRQWFETVWNGGRADLIQEYLAQDCVIHALDESGADGIGPASFEPFFLKLRSAFPDIRFTVHDVIGDDSRAAGRWSVSMTHTGEGMAVAPTHRPVSITGMGHIRVKDGKIVEAWNEWDRLGMAMALGTLQPS